MIEIVVRAAPKAEPFHDSMRSHVLRNGDGDQRIDVQRVERERQTGASRFRRIAVSPRVAPQSPRNFDTVNGGLPLDGEEPSEAQQTSAVFRFDREEPEAPSAPMIVKTLEESGGFLECIRSREKGHHVRIAVQFPQRRHVFRAPRPKKESRRFDRHARTPPSAVRSWRANKRSAKLRSSR